MSPGAASLWTTRPALYSRYGVWRPRNASVTVQGPFTGFRGPAGPRPPLAGLARLISHITWAPPSHLITSSTLPLTSELCCVVFGSVPNIPRLVRSSVPSGRWSKKSARRGTGARPAALAGLLPAPPTSTFVQCLPLVGRRGQREGVWALGADGHPSTASLVLLLSSVELCGVAGSVIRCGW